MPRVKTILPGDNNPEQAKKMQAKKKLDKVLHVS